MNRRLLAALLLCLAVASPALAVDSGDPPTPWWFRGLTFHVPFDDPAASLKTIRGAGAFTFTRAHDATHTATYVHPGTGLVTTASADQLRVEADGEEYQVEEQTLKAALEEIIRAPEYKASTDGPDGGKALMIRAKVTAYRDAAKTMLLVASPELRGLYEEKIQNRAEVLIGVN